MSNQLLYHLSDGVATITMNRPDKYNSVTREMALALQKAIDRAGADNEVRAIVLTGSGKAFCAGQDLREAMDPSMPDLGEIVEQHFNPLLIKMTQCPKPIIAAINGVAAGAGANLAIACDITIATASAVFIQAFSKIGLVPDSGGTYTLPRLVGHARASALMLLGDKVSAQEAVEMGMIYQAVPDRDFADTIARTATKVSQMPTRALALTKQALAQTWQNNLHDQLTVELQLQIEAGNTDDHREGVTAFVEKRKPTFTGK